MKNGRGDAEKGKWVVLKVTRLHPFVIFSVYLITYMYFFVVP